MEYFIDATIEEGEEEVVGGINDIMLENGTSNNEDVNIQKNNMILQSVEVEKVTEVSRMATFSDDRRTIDVDRNLGSQKPNSEKWWRYVKKTFVGLIRSQK